MDFLMNNLTLLNFIKNLYSILSNKLEMEDYEKILQHNFFDKSNSLIRNSSGKYKIKGFVKMPKNSKKYLKGVQIIGILGWEKLHIVKRFQRYNE